MMNIIFIAPPAAGKGTISSYLVDKYKYNHISTGDLLREVALTNQEIRELMQQGKFISDEIIFALIKEKLATISGPFILDGIPRNENQAHCLEKILEELNVYNYVVIDIDVPKDILEKRATGRRLCSSCGASYNIYFDNFKPQVENTCDKCKSSLYTREDDTLETYQVRYQAFMESTKPILDYYKGKGVLRKIDATKSNEEIVNSVEQILEGVKND